MVKDRPDDDDVLPRFSDAFFLFLRCSTRASKILLGIRIWFLTVGRSIFFDAEQLPPLPRRVFCPLLSFDSGGGVNRGSEGIVSLDSSALFFILVPYRTFLEVPDFLQPTPSHKGRERERDKAHRTE